MPKRKIPKTDSCFPENLKRIRRSADVTQEFVAEKIGVQRTTYTKWETGIAEPSFTCVAKLIDLFNEIGDIKVDYNTLFCKCYVSMTPVLTKD